MLGVASETDGGLGISFFSTAVSAAIGSTAGSGTSGMVVDDSWDQCWVEGLQKWCVMQWVFDLHSCLPAHPGTCEQALQKVVDSSKYIVTMISSTWELYLNFVKNSLSLTIGGSRGVHLAQTPLKDPIILFWHTNFMKCSHLRSPHPPWEILDLPLLTLQIILVFGVIQSPKLMHGVTRSHHCHHVIFVVVWKRSDADVVDLILYSAPNMLHVQGPCWEEAEAERFTQLCRLHNTTPPLTKSWISESWQQVASQGGGSVCDLLAKQWFIAQWIPSVTMEKSWTPIDSHCKNFNTLILSSHTWNIVKNCPSRIFSACRSDLDNSWQYSMYESSELRCWNFYNGSQWVFIIFPLSQMGSIVQ